MAAAPPTPPPLPSTPLKSKLSSLASGGVADQWINHLRRTPKDGAGGDKGAGRNGSHGRGGQAQRTGGNSQTTGDNKRPGPPPPPSRPSAAPAPPSQPRGNAGPSNLHQHSAHHAAYTGRNSHSSVAGPQSAVPPSRHREGGERAHAEPRYDAEFDRRGGPGLGSNGGTNRALFNPDERVQASAVSVERIRGEDAVERRRTRSKRDVVEIADLGAGRAKESKESLDSEEGGRPGSRSSKEGKHRRRREGERRRGEDREAGGAAVSQAASLGGMSSRQLFDPRRDDPVRFSHGSNNRKSTASDTRSLAPSTISIASSAPSINESNPVQDANSFMAQLRRAYKDIQDLEGKLQDEHRAALAAAVRDEEADGGVRIQGSAKKSDDDYWVRLAMGHKQLAEAHYSFLQLSLDPRQPASIHSLAQKYNIPSRLWGTAFHQLLERMRHAITSNSSDAPAANILEHLIEFIQFAYGHYSQLFEDPSITVFRSAWIDALGDLARYRMAVAGLALRVTASTQASVRSSTGRDPVPAREVQARPIDAASIGDAALGDWELEEQETWRVMARDWYGQGIAETPGVGRLHHHLALLSKGDEVRGLYHYSKSLSASHPYLSARESILPLFEDEAQARRTALDVSKSELFVHLHGMLFTKIALDDFESCLARFLERVSEHCLLTSRCGDDWSSLGTGTSAPWGDSEWFMVAVINISAMLQYGADDGVLKKAMNKDSSAAPTKPSSSTLAKQSKTPQAIMLNPSALKRSDLSPTDAGEPTANVLKQLNQTTEEHPLVFRLAQRLTFSILSVLLQHPYRRIGNSQVLNPYIVLLLTFISHMAQTPGALRHLEQAVPWRQIVNFLNTVPVDVEVRMDVQSKLVGGPLPEDWCVRGMDWTGRNLFGRGFWRASATGASASMAPPPMGESLESEMEALKFDITTIDEDTSAVPLASVTLALGRWKRVAVVAAWLARNVPGLDFDEGVVGSGIKPRFVLGGSLEAKLKRWKKEAQEAAEVERLSRITAWARLEDVEIEEEEESDEEDDEDPSDSIEVRDLKDRRRQLKAVIKQARLATRSSRDYPPQQSTSRRTKAVNTTLKVFPGHTVLVFDTNVLLGSMDLFRRLLETETWTIIVPLAVITELDGLKKNAASLGTAASDAIAYLEQAIRVYSRHLKIQTSRGNYLKDLTIRSENIDFVGSALEGGFSHDVARSMDDVILRAVAWQKDHFTSRLGIVNPTADRRAVPQDVANVVLLTGDRNLRLKARARGLDATASSLLDAPGSNGNG